MVPARHRRCSGRLKRYSDFIRAKITAIWNEEFAKKPRTTMASTTSSSPRGISLADFGQDVARRRAAIGDVVTPRNAGTRRTQSKRDLLTAIEDAGGIW